MTLDRIIKKLPETLQAEFDSEISKSKHWSPEWNNWAMETLLACNIARDEGFITKLEFETLRREKFSKLGGIIGEMPHTNLDFLEFCFYPGPWPEEGEKDE